MKTKLIGLLLLTASSVFASPVKVSPTSKNPPIYTLISTHKSANEVYALEFQMPNGQGYGYLSLAEPNCTPHRYGSSITFKVISPIQSDRGLCDNLSADALTPDESSYIAAMIEQTTADCPVVIKVNSSTLSVLEIAPSCHVAQFPSEIKRTVIIQK